MQFSAIAWTEAIAFCADFVYDGYKARASWNPFATIHKRIYRQLQKEVMCMNDKTMTFSLGNDREREIREILQTVYNALTEKGYNPINQLVGYILSEDPTYITTHNNARNLIRKVDRDLLLQTLVRYYLTH